MSEISSGQPKTPETVISPEQLEIDRLTKEMNTSLKQAKFLENLSGNENISNIHAQPQTTQDLVNRKKLMQIMFKNSRLIGLLEDGKIDLNTLKIIQEITDEMIKFLGS